MMNYGWQLDSEIWAQIPSDLAGSSSWKSVSFSESDLAGVDPKPGIYCICTTPVGCGGTSAESPNDLFSKLLTPIYIGKTDNLRRRFSEHCRRPSTKVSAAKRCFGSSLQFWFHRLPIDRIDIEEVRLINCFGPTANERNEKIAAKIGKAIAIGIQR